MTGALYDKESFSAQRHGELQIADFRLQMAEFRKWADLILCAGLSASQIGNRQSEIVNFHASAV